MDKKDLLSTTKENFDKDMASLADVQAAVRNGNVSLATETLITERGKTHGNWIEQSTTARQLKAIIDFHGEQLPAYQREALDMIAIKMSRILHGNPMVTDHWDDIAGYAKLGKAGHSS